MSIYTADRATRAFIEPCDSYQEALEAIEGYEEQDKANDCYEPNAYAIVDENHKIL